LARELLTEDSANYFDLEDPLALARLDEPKTALEPLSGLIVIDEVQRRPDLFPVLRVLADRRNQPARFLILGSASGDLMRQSSESLAGRMERIEIGGFTLAELGPEPASKLWIRGGFPGHIWRAATRTALSGRRQFIQTLLERDLQQWGVRVPAASLLRFWSMVAHYQAEAPENPVHILGKKRACSYDAHAQPSTSVLLPAGLVGAAIARGRAARTSPHCCCLGRRGLGAAAPSELIRAHDPTLAPTC
jgi:hypothetical protein